MSEEFAGSLEVEILADAEELAERAAAEVVAELEKALESSSRASWVVAGGSTPRRLYELLARRPDRLDWRRVELYWGDERCVEPSSPTSNYALVRETLLASLPIDRDRVHRIRGELPPAEAAREYDRRIRTALVERPFDLVLLGMGVDGHVASLFPAALPQRRGFAAPVEAPVEPRRRVTMTPEALARTRRLLFLVGGRDKAAAVARALEPGRTGRVVSDLVLPAAGDTLWLLDREAAGELPDPVVA